jgi:molybdopterin converting factor subunit 1
VKIQFEMAEARIIHIRFFAVLREQAGTSSLDLETNAITPAGLYRELQLSHKLAFDAKLLRVAINERYGTMDTALNAGDHVVFIPPVAGG